MKNRQSSGRQGAYRRRSDFGCYREGVVEGAFRLLSRGMLDNILQREGRQSFQRVGAGDVRLYSRYRRRMCSTRGEGLEGRTWC